jgi:hypothetical protein
LKKAFVAALLLAIMSVYLRNTVAFGAAVRPLKASVTAMASSSPKHQHSPRSLLGMQTEVQLSLLCRIDNSAAASTLFFGSLQGVRVPSSTD